MVKLAKDKKGKLLPAIHLKNGKRIQLKNYEFRSAEAAFVIKLEALRTG
eukprot:SAG31_NODE_15044_length_772_cov_1.366469_2_plen_48_part_01